MGNTVEFSTNHTLPLQYMTEEQFLDFLVVDMPSTMSLEDSVNKLETFIMAFASRERRRYEEMDGLNFTDEELDEIYEDSAVISYVTIMMFMNSERRRAVKWDKLSPAEKERLVLAAHPKRFYAHWEPNLNDPNAKPWPKGCRVVQGPEGYYRFAEKKKRFENSNSPENFPDELLQDPFLNCVEELSA